MAVHHPHLLDFSPPPSTVAMEPPHQPSSLDAATDMSSSSLGGVMPHRFLADDTTAAWPPAVVPLSLYNFNAVGGSLQFGHHHHQQLAVTPAAAASLEPDHHQQLMPASSMQALFQVRRSKYMGPAQELLAEFCSLQGDMKDKQIRAPKAGRWDDVETSSGLWGHPSLSSMDLLELERRKARLLSMVEEVDQRYRRYREQMRSVEASFEAVAGGGAAQVYTRLALRAMSRHFRCLRDALVAQLRKLRNSSAMGDSQTALGATKGDTPRLKVLDQCLRQQRAFQQPGTIDNYPWRPQRGLPERAVAVLRAWLFEHFLHPYPNDVDKHILARQTGLSRSQVSNWFINARVRLWKPMIEDMYTEEVKQQSDQHPNGGGLGAVKPEQHNTLTAAAMAGQSHFPTNNHTATTISSSIGGGQHHLHYPPPSIHGGAVSLTLGLQHQQPPFTSTMVSHHQRSLMLQSQDQEPAVLPYRDLAGSQFLHDLAG